MTGPAQVNPNPPVVGGDSGTWGTKLNQEISDVITNLNALTQNPNTSYDTLGEIGTALTTLFAGLAARLPLWQPNTAYTANQFVLNPSGLVVYANASFTSGASYNSANWTVVATGGGGSASPATSTVAGVIQLAGDLAGSSASPQVAKVNGTTVPASTTAATYLRTTAAGTAAWSPISVVDNGDGTVTIS